MALILLATHNETLRSKTHAILERANHIVASFKDTASAKNWLERAPQKPNLVIVDVGLKIFGGLEFIQYVKLELEAFGVRVLALTMKTNCDIYEFCDGNLIMPHTHFQLIQHVDMILNYQPAIDR